MILLIWLKEKLMYHLQNSGGLTIGMILKTKLSLQLINMFQAIKLLDAKSNIIWPKESRIR